MFKGILCEGEKSSSASYGTFKDISVSSWEQFRNWKIRRLELKFNLKSNAVLFFEVFKLFLVSTQILLYILSSIHIRRYYQF